MNAKIVLLSLALVASVATQAPSPVYRPSGRVLLLPAQPQLESDAAKTSNEESSRLLDQGEYYVLLEDGRLQMVKYEAAALKEDKPAPQQPQYQEPQPFHYVQVEQQKTSPQEQPAGYRSPFPTGTSTLQQQQNAAPASSNPQAAAPASYRSPFPTGTSTFQQQQNAAPASSNPQAAAAAGYRSPFPSGTSTFQQQQNAAPASSNPQAAAPAGYRSPFPAGTSTFQQQKSAVPAPINPQAADPAKLQAEPFAQFQVEYFQFPQAQSSQDTKAAQKEADAEEVSGFEAKVQYRDVKPITAPVYAYNPAPLVRILKK